MILESSYKNETPSSFIKDKELANKLAEDINEMEKMLNEYLHLLAHLILKTRSLTLVI